MKKIDAIKYLVENTEYRNEWTGTGMWEAVVKVVETKKRITMTWLKQLLAYASER